jgi:hypothetical protein
MSKYHVMISCVVTAFRVAMLENLLEMIPSILQMRTWIDRET